MLDCTTIREKYRHIAKPTVQETKVNSLRIARARAGLTLSELADRAGVGLNTISAIERGRQAPQAVTVHRLARALGVDPAELAEREKVPS